MSHNEIRTVAQNGFSSTTVYRYFPTQNNNQTLRLLSESFTRVDIHSARCLFLTTVAAIRKLERCV